MNFTGKILTIIAVALIITGIIITVFFSEIAGTVTIIGAAIPFLTTIIIKFGKLTFNKRKKVRAQIKINNAEVKKTEIGNSKANNNVEMSDIIIEGGKIFDSKIGNQRK